MTEQVGPGQSCVYCGEGYGLHDDNCRRPRSEPTSVSCGSPANDRIAELLKENIGLKLKLASYTIQIEAVRKAADKADTWAYWYNLWLETQMDLIRLKRQIEGLPILEDD